MLKDAASEGAEGDGNGDVSSLVSGLPTTNGAAPADKPMANNRGRRDHGRVAVVAVVGCR